jgi:hypothetical protein
VRLESPPTSRAKDAREMGHPGCIFGEIKNAACEGRVVILSLLLFYQFGGGKVDIFGEIYLAWGVGVRGNWGGLGA